MHQLKQPFDLYALYSELRKPENQVSETVFTKAGVTLEILDGGRIRKFSHQDFEFLSILKGTNHEFVFQKGNGYDVKYAMQELVPPRFHSYSGILSSSEVMIWKYDNAREDLQALSHHGGDEDYIILIKKFDFEQDHKFERIVDSLTVCDYQQILVFIDDEEYYLFITAHS